MHEKPQTTELLLSHQLEVVVDTLKLIPGASLILRESEELSFKSGTDVFFRPAH